eukprot:2328585-Rhodomonas_salina.1
MVSNAARIIAMDNDLAVAGKAEALKEADFLRRSGHHDASMLYFARTVPYKQRQLKHMLVQPYNYDWALNVKKK